jgi:ferrochelatase
VSHYDALLIVSFGGPEKHEDVIPFLENVLRGRNVPRERMLEVAKHYYHFDGRSPINDQNRALIGALKEYFALRERISLPIYWGNRNWHPMLAETVRQMRDDGVRHALAFVTSAFGSYSGCRQYIENIEQARAEVEGAPRIDKIRPFSAHPKFLEAMTDRARTAFLEFARTTESGSAESSGAPDTAAARAAPVRAPEQLPQGRLVFTAHSVPVAMAQSSPYVRELEQACAAVAGALGRREWDLAWQSRSGPPTQAWLEPDIRDYLRASRSDAVIVPIGFLSDHMEVIYDLDVEVRQLAEELGIRIARARTVETHPAMIEMIAEFVQQEHQRCDVMCCAAARRPAAK